MTKRPYHTTRLPAHTTGIAQQQTKTGWKNTQSLRDLPRSFQDSPATESADHTTGITSRLDYLKDSANRSHWITPMYPSPGVDYGTTSRRHRLDPSTRTMADLR